MRPSWCYAESPTKGSRVPPTKSPRFWSNELTWPVDRRDRRFDVFVVEPDAYDPKSHRTVFEAAINAFIQLENPPR